MRRLLLSTFLLCAVSFLPAAADEIADEIADEALLTEIDIISDAEEYYQSNNLPYPLANVEAMTDYKEVADSANSILALFPDDTFALRCRSIANYHLGKYKESAQDILKVYCFTGSYEDANTVYAVADKDRNVVINQLIEYLNHSPYDEDSILCTDCRVAFYPMLGVLYKDNEEMEKAYATAKTTIKLFDELGMYNSDNKVFLSTILLRTGHADKALSLLKDYADDDYYSGPIVNYLLALRDTGNSYKAFKIFERLIEQDPENERIKLDYATMLAANDIFEEATYILDNIISAHEDNPEQYVDEGQTDLHLVEALVRRGVVKIIVGDTEEGRDDLTKSLTLKRDDIPYTGYELTAYAYLGNKAALDEVMKDYNFIPTGSQASLCAVYGDYDKSLKYVKESFNNHSNCPDQMFYDINFRNIMNLPEYRALVKSYKPMKLK